MLRATSQSLRKIGLFSKESLAAHCNSRDLNVVQNGSITELHLRRDWNGNTLTQKTINGLRVSLQLMEEDYNSKAIMIRSKGDYFSRGADYLYLGHLGLNKQSGVEEYFAALYDLIYFIGRMETPLIPLINGKANGAAACLSNLATFSIATPNTTMSFPETSFGFIPTGGASYHLSRLPGEVGMYLALTGKTINGSDAVHLKFAYNFSHLTDEFLCDLHSTSAQLSTPIESHKLFGDYYTNFRSDKDILDEQNDVENWNELSNRIGWSSFYKERRENVKMVYADILHRESMRRDSWSEVQGNEWRSHISPGAQNHLRNYEASVMGKKIWSSKSYFSLFNDLKAIYRCFTANTLSEAIERINRELEYGDKEWARDTFSRLSGKSPLALEATYRLIKEAKNLEWAECLDREFNVALKLAKQPDFHEASIKILSRHPGVPQWKVNFPVPQNLIDDLFQMEKTLDLEGVKPNQFLPVKEWYKTFASGPRHWLNETTTDHYYARMSFNEDVQSFLHDHDVDVRDPCVEASEVRKGFWNAEMYKKKMDEELDRVQKMAEDPLLKEFYVNDRKKAINDMFTNEAEITKKINDLITKRFERKFEDRINTIFDRSRNARSLEKQEFFREVKDFVHRKHFLENEGNLEKLEENDHERMKADDLPMKIPLDGTRCYIDDLQRDIIAKGETNPNIVKYDDLVSIEDYKAYFALYHPAFLEKDIAPELNQVGKEIWDKFRKSTDSMFYGQPRDVHIYEEQIRRQKISEGLIYYTHKELKDMVPDEVYENAWLYHSEEENANEHSSADENDTLEGKEFSDEEHYNSDAELAEEAEKGSEGNEDLAEFKESEVNELFNEIIGQGLTSSGKMKKEALAESEEEEVKTAINEIVKDEATEGELSEGEAKELEADLEVLKSEGIEKEVSEEEPSEGEAKELEAGEEESVEGGPKSEQESESEWGIPRELPEGLEKEMKDEVAKHLELTGRKMPSYQEMLNYIEALMKGEEAKLFHDEKASEEKTETNEPEYYLQDKAIPREASEEAKAKTENAKEEISEEAINEDEILNIHPKKISKKAYKAIPYELKGMEDWTEEDWNLHFALLTTSRRNVYHYGELNDFKLVDKEDEETLIKALKEAFGVKNSLGIEENMGKEEKEQKIKDETVKLEESLKADKEIIKSKEGLTKDLQILEKVRAALKKIISNKREREMEKNEENAETIKEEIMGKGKNQKPEVVKDFQEKYSVPGELVAKSKEESKKGQGENELSQKIKEQEEHDEDMQRFALYDEENASGASQSSSSSSSSGMSQSGTSSSEELYEGKHTVYEAKTAKNTNTAGNINEANQANKANKLSQANEPCETDESKKPNEANETAEAKEFNREAHERDKLFESDEEISRPEWQEIYSSDQEIGENDPELSPYKEEKPSDDPNANPKYKTIGPGIGFDQNDMDAINPRTRVPRKPDKADELQLELARPDESEREEIDNEYGEAESLVAKELKKEIYIKTGFSDIEEGLNFIKEKGLYLNIQDMKRRRIEVLRKELKADDYIYHTDPNKKRLKKLFGDLLIKPELNDIDKNILGVLELESLEEVLSEVERLRKEKIMPRAIEKETTEVIEDKRDEAEENLELLENMEDEKKSLIMTDFANRIMLDKAYLNAVVGSRAYLPIHLTLTEKDVKGLKENIGLCDFAQSAKEWAEISLQRAIDEIFDIRAELELKMTRAELIAYDRSIEEKFKPQNIKKDMLKQLSLESVAAYKTFDIVTDHEREEVLQSKPAEFLQEMQNKLNKNMDTRRMEYAKQLYGHWYSKTQMGKPKDRNPDYLIEEDLTEKFRNYDIKHEKYSKLPKTKEGFARYWTNKKYVNIRQRAEDHAREREEVRELENKMNRAAEIACTIENLLKSKKVRDKVGPENVEAVKKIIADRDNLIF